MKRTQSLEIASAGGAELDLFADHVRDRRGVPVRADVLFADPAAHGWTVQRCRPLMDDPSTDVYGTGRAWGRFYPAVNVSESA